MEILNELMRYLRQTLKSKASLKERMLEYLSYWAPKRNNFNYKVFTIKMKKCKTYNLERNYKNIQETCVKIYKDFNPIVIYFTHKEINVVFKDLNAFDSDITLHLTKLVSMVSVYYYRFSYETTLWTGQYIEFDQDHDVMNYLIWRQRDLMNGYKQKSMNDLFIYGRLMKKELVYRESTNDNGCRGDNMALRGDYITFTTNFHQNDFNELYYKLIENKYV